MKKRLLVIALLAIMLLTICMAMFCGCVDEDPEPRDVELELVNPNTGEAVKWDETIDLPEEGTPIEVRIKDKESGEYLTDDDLPENTIKGSYYITFYVLGTDNEEIDRWNPNGYWPTKDYLNEEWPRSQYNHYEVKISFDCRPKNPENPREFQRKYKMKTDYVYFYINKR